MREMRLGPSSLKVPADRSARYSGAGRAACGRRARRAADAKTARVNRGRPWASNHGQVDPTRGRLMRVDRRAHDRNSRGLAVSALRRWKREGRRVRIARPPRGMDFNDLLVRHAPRIEEPAR